MFPDLTVLENLKIGAYLRKDSLEDDLNWGTTVPPLKERSWQAAGTLSGGEQQMLAVGRALMSRPKIMMMDEPSLGLAPIVVKGIFDIIREINKQGVTILLVEQNANMALKCAEWATCWRPGGSPSPDRRDCWPRGREEGLSGHLNTRTKRSPPPMWEAGIFLVRLRGRLTDPAGPSGRRCGSTESGR